MSPTNTRKDLLKWVQGQLADADACGPDHIVKAQVSNALARQVMGWSLHDEDSRRLWRTEDGAPVEWHMPDRTVVALCAQPWVDGINTNTDVAFAPGTNYHASRIDWRKVVIETAAAKSLQIKAPDSV